MSIGARLYNLRKDRNLSKAEAAGKFDVSNNTIIRWENDGFEPSKLRLSKISKFYGVSTNWILTGVVTDENKLESKLSAVDTDIKPVPVCYETLCDEEIGAMPTFGERLRSLRMRCGWTLIELAAKIGVSKGTIYSWEHTGFFPQKKRQLKIAEIFSVPVELLINGTELDKESLFIVENMQVMEQGWAVASVGERIKYIRVRNRMRFPEFAAVVGVKPHTVSRWENGNFTTGAPRLMKIAESFDVSFTWLQDGVGSEDDVFEGEATDCFEPAEVLYDNVENATIGHATDVSVGTDTLSPETLKLLHVFEKLSVIHKGQVIGYIDSLCRDALCSEMAQIG